MGSRSKFASVWKRQTVHKATIAALPALAGISLFYDNIEVMFWSSVVLPLGLMLGDAFLSRETRRNAPAAGKGGMVAEITSQLEVAQTSERMACLMLELDDARNIQREWGSEAVEMIHRELVLRLTSFMRRSDNVFILGTGKIGVVLSDVRTPELNALISMIKRLQEGLHQPFALDGATLQITVSVGFCLDLQSPQRAAVPMMEATERALVEAKLAGHGSVRAYSSLTPRAEYNPTALEAEVLEALTCGQVIPYFQPQISTDTGQITGFEALARWHHPDHGLIPPSEFIPLLEKAGKMEDLSEVILDQSLRALVAWDKAGLDVPTVSVNFATQELRNPSLVERIKWDVDRFDLEPRRLTVEVLETVISDHEDDVITRNIRELGNQGFNIDLDDFGTGHATLSNVRRFKVDRIKIDRSFVARADEDPEQQRMVSAIVGMAERLEIDTLAEGVETIGEQSILSQLGCTHLQGFGIARPMPLDESIEWMQEHQEKLASPILFHRKSG